MRWSYSAHTTMRRCARQLAYGQIVASPTSTDPLRREAYICKQLQHASTWQGRLVHEILAIYVLADLRAKRTLSARRLSDLADELAWRQFHFSESRRYRDAGVTKQKAGEQYCALFEHERGLPIGNGDVERVLANVHTCFDNLAAAKELLSTLYSARDHESEIVLEFELDGASIVAKLDLVCTSSDGRLVIVDWKVSESDTADYSRQLLVYALAVSASRRWQHASGIELVEANLLRGVVRRHQLALKHLDEAEDFVYRGVNEMRATFGDGSFDALDLDDLDVARSANTCRFCNYSRLCAKSLATPDPANDIPNVQGVLL